MLTISSSLNRWVVLGSIVFSGAVLAAGHCVPRIIVAPLPAGVAIHGIDGKHAGTQQFTATEISSDCAISDVTATAIWSSSNTAKATIAPGGLATGVASTQSRPVMIRVSDPNNGLIGRSILTVMSIDTIHDNGLVYCMGTGADITNCAYLPPGAIGGVIAATDNSPGISWWNSTATATGATSPNNGSANTALLTGDSAPNAATTCTGLGDGWYLPSQYELAVAARNAVRLEFGPNPAQLANNYDDYYWTSTECTAKTSGPSYAFAENFFGETTASVDKGSAEYVRCVNTFDH